MIDAGPGINMFLLRAMRADGIPECSTSVGLMDAISISWLSPVLGEIEKERLTRVSSLKQSCCEHESPGLVTHVDSDGVSCASSLMRVSMVLGSDVRSSRSVITYPMS